MKNDKPYIIICGDLVVTQSNIALFEAGNVQGLVGSELANILNNSVINIINLEGPITTSQCKIQKDGSPNISQSPKMLNFLDVIRPVLIVGANNHILDYGRQGITDTIECLNKLDISFIGFGTTELERNKTYIKEINGCLFGVYSCAENEFSTIYDNGSGAKAYDEYITYREIYALKEKCDYLVVIYHGGRENYRYPSPKLKLRCERMIENGANIVICQHSHCIGCEEKYKGGVIVYGQGNMIFDYGKKEEWRTSLWVKLVFDDEIRIEYIPVEKKGETIVYSKDNTILTDFFSRSKEITSEEIVNEKWEQFVGNQAGRLYLGGVLGVSSRIILKIDRILSGMITRRVLKQNNRKNVLLNYLRCESIRESIETIMNLE